MNRKPSGLLISHCIDGFVKYKNSAGIKPHTVDSKVFILDLNSL